MKWKRNNTVGYKFKISCYNYVISCFLSFVWYLFCASSVTKAILWKKIKKYLLVSEITGNNDSVDTCGINLKDTYNGWKDTVHHYKYKNEFVSFLLLLFIIRTSFFIMLHLISFPKCHKEWKTESVRIKEMFAA